MAVQSNQKNNELQFGSRGQNIKTSTLNVAVCCGGKAKMKLSSHPNSFDWCLIMEFSVSSEVFLPVQINSAIDVSDGYERIYQNNALKELYQITAAFYRQLVWWGDFIAIILSALLLMLYAVIFHLMAFLFCSCCVLFTFNLNFNFQHGNPCRRSTKPIAPTKTCQGATRHCIVMLIKRSILISRSYRGIL